MSLTQEEAHVVPIPAVCWST